MTKKKKKQPNKPLPAEHSRRGVVLIMLVYFCSGMCSLIDEVIWVRLLKLALGNTVYASSIVVSVFMGGLALGALLMARYADRIERKLRLYAGLELLVTVSALMMPLALRVAEAGYKRLFVAFGPSTRGLLVVQLVVSACLLLVPTMLMGSTLPLLGRYVTSIEQRVGHLVGRLYALNTFGAAVGCFLAGFVLIRLVGVMGSLYVAAALNLLVALGGFLLSRRNDAPRAAFSPPRAKPAAGDSDAHPAPPAGRRLLLAVCLLSGLVSIGYELIWMRSVALPLGSYTYVFSAVLTVYLLGNVIGAWIGSRLSRRLSNHAVAFGLCMVVLGAFGIAYIPFFKTWFTVIKQTPVMTSLLTAMGVASDIRLAVQPITDSLFLFLMPAVVMGIGFPLVLQAWGSMHHAVGRTTGTIYGVNTIGAVVGGIATGFVLIPLLGVQLSAMILGLLAMWLGLATVQLFHRAPHPALRLCSAAPVLLLTAACLVIPTDTFRRIVGMTYSGRPIHIEEGVTTTVGISEHPDGTRSMAIDHIEMAGDGIRRSAQKTLGHLPVLLHGNPETVLSFGFGSGETVACLAKHDLDRIDCVEIAPEVTRVALEYFSHVNLGEELDRYVNMIHMDGRNYLKMTPRRYDIIVNDSNVHRTSGSAPLFTREHFRNALTHLRPGGLFMTKLHLQGHPKSNFDSILATFIDAFPHATVWFPVTRPFVFFYLVGSREPQSFAPARIQELLDKPAVRDSVDYLYFDHSADVLACYIADEHDIRRYLARHRINTDNHPFIEFNLDPTRLSLSEHFPRLIEIMRRGSLQNHIDWTGMSAPQIERWKQAYDLRNRVAVMLLAAHAQPTFFSRLINSREGLRLLPAYGPLVELRSRALEGIGGALSAGRVNPDQVIADMDALIAREPEFGAAWLVKSMALTAGQRIEPALTAARRAVQLAADCPEAHAHLGMLHLYRNQLAAAADALRRALELRSDYPLARYNLALALAQQGDAERALEHYRRAVRRRPDLDGPQLHVMLAAGYAEKQQYRPAVAAAEKALSLAETRGDAESAALIQRRLQTYRRKLPNSRND